MISSKSVSGARSPNQCAEEAVDGFSLHLPSDLSKLCKLWLLVRPNMASLHRHTLMQTTLEIDDQLLHQAMQDSGNPQSVP